MRHCLLIVVTSKSSSGNSSILLLGSFSLNGWCANTISSKSGGSTTSLSGICYWYKCKYNINNFNKGCDILRDEVFKWSLALNCFSKTFFRAFANLWHRQGMYSFMSNIFLIENDHLSRWLEKDRHFDNLWPASDLTLKIASSQVVEMSRGDTLWCLHHVAWILCAQTSIETSPKENNYCSRLI